MTLYQPGAEIVSTLTGAERIGIDTGGAQVAVTTTAAISALTTSQTGTVTVNGVTPVTVTNDAITADSIVIFTLKTVGGTVGAYPAIQTITAATGFTVAATASDTSVYNYLILN
jgi:hypothetical protein